MGPQTADEHSGFGQAVLPWHKLHILVTAGAQLAVVVALLADDVVHDVVTPANITWRVPLKDNGRLVHAGDHIPWAGWNTCKQKIKYREELAQKRKGTGSRQHMAQAWITFVK